MTSTTPTSWSSTFSCRECPARKCWRYWLVAKRWWSCSPGTASWRTPSRRCGSGPKTFSPSRWRCRTWWQWWKRRRKRPRCEWRTSSSGRVSRPASGAGSSSTGPWYCSSWRRCGWGSGSAARTRPGPPAPFRGRSIKTPPSRGPTDRVAPRNFTTASAENAERAERLRIGNSGAVLLIGLLSLPSALAAQQRDIVLATTTSVRDAGLLDFLLPPFERESGRAVKVIAVGSGQAMELGRRGEADLLIVHHQEAELAFVAQGFGSERFPFVHNEFAILGPRGDPAGIRGSAGAVAALQAIGRAKSAFVSRGDRSGTHAKELVVWRLAGLAPNAKSDAWYLESGQGMGATLQIASELEAYTLTDIGTYLTHASPLELTLLVED